MKDGLLRNISVRVIPATVWFLTRLLFATYRVREHGREQLQAVVDSKRQAVCTFWHYSILVIFPLMRKHSGVAMVSSSSDGEYIARLAEHYGFSTVRGSRNRQGIAALKELIRSCREGRNAALVADGSQGPARIAQPGAVLLASRTEMPILPVVWSASNFLAVRSWDRTAFPWPFSTVDVMYGEPIEVPADLRGEALEEYRLLLENRLNTMYRQMWSLHGVTEH